MPLAEVLEVFDFVARAKINVLRIDAVAAEPGSDALRPSPGDHTDREAVHACHSDGKAILGVKSPVKLSFEIRQDPTVRHHPVNIERECLDVLEICHYDLAPLGPN